MTEKPSQGRRERKKEETRRRIIGAAIALFAEHGFEDTTMEGIADAADVAKATLYSYFPVKEALVIAHLQEVGKDAEPLFRQMLRQVPDTRSRLHALYRASAHWFEEHPDILRIYLRYRLPNLLATHDDPSQRSGFEARLLEVIAAGQSAGEIRADMPKLNLARLLEGMSLHVWIGRLADPGAWPLEQSLMQMVDVFLQGAAPRKG